MQKLAPHSGSEQLRSDRSRSSDRVLAVLKVVADSEQPPSLTEIANAVDLPASTALRQLRSLEAAGLVARGDDQAYRPGGELVRMAHRVVAGSPLVDLAGPLLDRVARIGGESAYLAVADAPGTCVYLATAPGPQPLRHAGWIGRQVPTRATAVGAALDGAVDPDGAVFRSDAHEPGVAAVSAPVRDASGSVVAAISAVGPTFRLVGEELEGARAAVIIAAQTLSGMLGA